MLFKKWLSLFQRSSKGPKSEPADSYLEVAEAVERMELRKILPDLSNKTVLEVAPECQSVSSLIQEKRAQTLICYGTTTGAMVKGRLESLPFQGEAFDFVLGRSLRIKKGFPSLIQELGRVVKAGGEILLTDQHPFSPLGGEKRKEIVSEEGRPICFEDYLKLFEKGNGRLKRIREVFFDRDNRRLVSERLKVSFDDLKRKPFLMFWLFQKEK